MLLFPFNCIKFALVGKMWGKFREKNFGFVKRKSAVSCCLTAPCFLWDQRVFLATHWYFRTQSRGRTGTGCPTGVWDQRVYRFRHLGLIRAQLDSQLKAGAKVRHFFELPKVFIKNLKIFACITYYVYLRTQILPIPTNGNYRQEKLLRDTGRRPWKTVVASEPWELP